MKKNPYQYFRYLFSQNIYHLAYTNGHGAVDEKSVDKAEILDMLISRTID